MPRQRVVASNSLVRCSRMQEHRNFSSGRWWSSVGRLVQSEQWVGSNTRLSVFPLHTRAKFHPPRYGGEGEPASANSIACSSACPRISTRIEPPRTSQSAAERTSWPMFVDTIGRTRSPCKSKT